MGYFPQELLATEEAIYEQFMEEEDQRLAAELEKQKRDKDQAEEASIRNNPKGKRVHAEVWREAMACLVLLQYAQKVWYTRPSAWTCDLGDGTAMDGRGAVVGRCSAVPLTLRRYYISSKVAEESTIHHPPFVICHPPPPASNQYVTSKALARLLSEALSVY